MSEVPFACTINNRAYDELKNVQQDLPLGRWLIPPIDVPRRKQVEITEVTRQLRTPSVRGFVKYQVGGDETAWVKIGWDLPGVSGTTNIVNVETSHPDIIATLDGFLAQDETESITVTVADVRPRDSSD